MCKLKYLGLGTMFFVGTLFTSLNAISSCEIKNPNQFLELIKKNHPAIKLNRSLSKSAVSLVDIAKERPNPEMNIQSIRGNSEDSEATKSNLSIQHTVEWGGKRDSRIELALKTVDTFQNEVRGNNEDIIIDAIVKAYRLRQVFDLLPIYQEASSAFEKILSIKSYQKSLSPEEQVEKETLTLATNGYKLKVAKLNAEKINLSKHLSLFIGKDCIITPSVLPIKIDTEKNFSIKDGVNNYSKLQFAQGSLDVATASLKLSQANSYPNIKIGPSFEFENSNGQENQSIGFSLTMDLPLLNSNQGQRKKAATRLRAANINLINIEREASLDLNSWINKYETFTSSLKGTSSRADLEKKHNRIEKLFKRGVISTAMVIESHRQLIEFSNFRFEFELGAVKALWNIYKLNGSVLDKKL